MSVSQLHPKYKPWIVDSKTKGAYGDSIVASQVPIISGNATYDFIPANFRSFTAGFGSTAAEDGCMKASSGTMIGNYGAIRSFRSLNHKKGLGASIRFSGFFIDPSPLTWSGMGGFNIGDELSFGYNGETFGIWHRYGGLAEVQEIQITTPASGSETAAITLNNILYNVPLTSGTAQHNAFEIAEYLDANADEIGVEQLDDKVIIDYLSDGDKTGTFSFSSSSAVGVFTELNAGVSKTSVHIPISEWNGNKIPNFDPTNGNSYQIDFQSGYGDIRFEIEDPGTGDYIIVHTIEWANSGTQENLRNPSLRVGCYATAIGNTTETTACLSYITAFITGEIRNTRNPRAFDSTKNIGTTLTNIFTLRNSRVYNGFSNQVEMEPFYVDLANDGAKTAIFEIRGNPTVSGEPNFQPNGNNLVSEIDEAGDAVSGGRLLGAFTVAKGQSVVINLKDLDIRIPPSLRFVICGKMSSGSASDLSASLIWYEDV